MAAAWLVWPWHPADAPARVPVGAYDPAGSAALATVPTNGHAFAPVLSDAFRRSPDAVVSRAQELYLKALALDPHDASGKVARMRAVCVALSREADRLHLESVREADDRRLDRLARLQHGFPRDLARNWGAKLHLIPEAPVPGPSIRHEDALNEGEFIEWANTWRLKAQAEDFSHTLSVIDRKPGESRAQWYARARAVRRMWRPGYVRDQIDAAVRAFVARGGNGVAAATEPKWGLRGPGAEPVLPEGGIDSLPADWRAAFVQEQALRREAERENRIHRAREQDREEREQGPADIEGIAGHPALLTLRDKNFEELRRLVDGLPTLPFLRPRKPFDHLPPLGADLAIRTIRIEVTKFVDSVMVSEAHNGRIVGDRQLIRQFIYNRADLLCWSDPIGDLNREDLLLMAEFGFAQAVPSVWGGTRETEILEREAERKGFG